MEPMIRAIQTENPEFDLQETDIVACGSTMGNLLRFARGSDKAFRILVETVGDTVFFLRRENSPLELIPNVYGYGHAFSEAYTTWRPEVKGPESHQRVVSYELSSMKVLLRFEGDGFLSELAEEHESSPEPTSISSSSDAGDSSSENELVASMLNAGVSSVYPSDNDKSSGALRIERRGQSIPQSAIFDLKTRSIRKIDIDTLSEELPRLWIAQIPNFMLAHHRSGVFSSIKVHDTTQEVKVWEVKNANTLLPFAGLLKKIVDVARGTSTGKLEIVREADGKELELREPGGDVKGVLPPYLIEWWESSV
ncbi:hypothetical protein N7540_000299 [Penicillium herquei]|nr:hypothetical protein N7540_000299 [Penicillium herquei]